MRNKIVAFYLLCGAGMLSIALWAVCTPAPPPPEPAKPTIVPVVDTATKSPEFWTGFVLGAERQCKETALNAANRSEPDPATITIGSQIIKSKPEIPQALFASAKRAITDDTFHFAVHGQPKSCDPHKMYTVIEFTIIANTSEGLLTWGAKGPESGAMPGMASAWTVSADGLTYTFTIGADRRWSNGDAVTAHDFVWSWNRVRAKETGALYGFLFDEAKIATYMALNDHAFEVKLSEPRGFSHDHSFFLDLMTMPVFHPVHRKTVETYGAAWCQPEHWVGSGAYVPTKMVTNGYITLAKNKHYWDAKNVSIEQAVGYLTGNVRVHVDNYKLGMLDWLGPSVTPPSADLDQITDPATNEFTVRDATRYLRAGNLYISANVKRKGFDDVRVRTALSLAINRTIIADKIIKDGSVPTMTFVTPGLGSYKNLDRPVMHECAQAQELLAEAGYPVGKGFPRYEFLYRSETDNEPKVASAIAQMWKECLGIEVTTTGIKMNQWQERTTQKNYDITIDGWQGDYPHPQTFAALMKCGAETNNPGWCNKTYDEELAKAVAASAPEDIQLHYCVLEVIAEKDMPNIPLFFTPRINLLRPEWTGFHGNVMLHHPIKYMRRASTQL